MPDHLHALLSFPATTRMDKVIRDWKRFVAKRTAVTWQDGFFDHRVRSNENLEETTAYIRRNPMRAGLADDDALWPYVWAPDGDAPAR